MNSTSESLEIRPNSTIKRTHTFISNSQTDFASDNRPHIHESYSTEYKSISMTDMNPESSSKDFSHEYERLKSASHPLLPTEDEDDGDLLSHRKTRVNQESQVIFDELKAKKKKKHDHSKKIKSILKRRKESNGPQIPPATSTTRLTSSGDITTSMKSSTSTIRTDENNGTKSTITVDISKARSNLEVVRLCIRELGWKEVENFLLLDLFFSIVL